MADIDVEWSISMAHHCSTRPAIFVLSTLNPHILFCLSRPVLTSAAPPQHGGAERRPRPGLWGPRAASLPHTWSQHNKNFTAQNVPSPSWRRCLTLDEPRHRTSPRALDWHSELLKPKTEGCVKANHNTVTAWPRDGGKRAEKHYEQNVRKRSTFCLTLYLAVWAITHPQTRH